MYLYHSGLCPNTYPDEVCRRDFERHDYDPPLLYDLNSDPGEIYNLKVTEHADVMATIDKVSNLICYRYTYIASVSLALYTWQSIYGMHVCV